MTWNTRLVWTGATAIVIHILYLLWGYSHFSDITLLHQEIYGDYIMFDGVQFVVSVMISVVLLVVWMMYLFKNNALKSFYPQNGRHIFAAFAQYVIIVFLCISFPVSYVAGYKIFLNTRFDKTVIKEEAAHLSRSRVFFLETPSDYFISNRVYPAPYDTLFAVASSEIDERYPVIRYEQNATQFYTYMYRDFLYDTFVSRQYDEQAPYSDEKEITRVSSGTDSIRVFYTDKFVDLSRTADPHYSLYNYSGAGAEYKRYQRYYDDEADYNGGYTSQAPDTMPASSLSKAFRTREFAYNKYVYELLQRNDPGEIKALLSGTLAILKKYRIATNLDADNWYRLVYNPPLFRVDSFISGNQYNAEYAEYSTATVAETVIADANVSPRYTRYLLETSKAFYTLDNIRSLSAWSFAKDVATIFFCVAMGLATVLLMYRVTGLKTLLFTVISMILISILVGLLIFQIHNLNYNYAGDREEGTLVSLYIVAFVYTGIALLPLLLWRSFRKIVSGIALSITVLGFPYFVWLVLLLINTHQEIAVRELYEESPDLYVHLQYTLLNRLAPVTVVAIIVAVTIVFMFLYTAVIKRWKGLPEG